MLIPIGMAGIHLSFNTQPSYGEMVEKTGFFNLDMRQAVHCMHHKEKEASKFYVIAINLREQQQITYIDYLRR